MVRYGFGEKFLQTEICTLRHFHGDDLYMNELFDNSACSRVMLFEHILGYEEMVKLGTSICPHVGVDNQLSSLALRSDHARIW